MKILIVAQYYPPHIGGLEVVAHKQALGFAAFGHQVRVVTCCIKDAPVGDVISEGISINRSSACSYLDRRFGLPIALPGFALFSAIKKEAESADILVVHDVLYPTSWAAFFWARLYGKPLIVVQHVADIPYRSRSLAFAVRLANRTIAPFLLRKASEVVFISEIVRQHFEKSLRRKSVRIIYNGVDRNVFRAQPPAARSATRQKLGLGKNEKVALFVGRFVEKKGLHKLRSLVGATPEVRWIFVGRGPRNPRVWDASNVCVFDHMSAFKLAELYNAADLLVLPSVGEGFPLVVQEALACGLPCLVSEEIQMACPEAAALLFSAGPRAEKLSEAFAKSFGQIDLKRREERARQAHALWSWDQCAGAYLRIFDSYCKTQPNRAGIVTLSHAKA